MKALNRFRLVRVFLLTATALFGASSANAAKVDFSEFAGKYVGTWVITASSQTIAAAVTTTVEVNKPGTNMTVDFSGLLSVSTQVVPILATYKFNAKNRKLLATSPLAGFAGPAVTLPTRFSGSKSRFNFTTVAAPGATLVGSDISGSFASYSLKFSKKKLTLTGTGSIVLGSGGTPQAVQFFVTLNKKKGGK